MRDSVNLLPFTFRRGVLLRRRARQWGALWAFAAVIAVAVGCAGFLPHDDAESARLEADQRLNARLGRSEKRLADAKTRLSTLRQQEAILLNPVDETPGLLVLGVVSRCAGQVESGIQVEGLSLSRKDPTSGAQSLAAGSARKDQRLLTLKGIASDSLAVAAFAAGLRDSGVFASVERESSPTHETDEKRPVPYLIECHF